MLTVLVDYDSGNLHSAEKAFQRMAVETGAGDILVSSRPEDVARADRIVLPGDGAFPACRKALGAYGGLFEAIEEAITTRARPFLGICVGMQMMATWGREYEDTKGFDWIPGEVVKISPGQPCAESPAYGLERSGDRSCPPGAERHPDWRSRLFCAFLPFQGGQSCPPAGTL